MALNIRSVTIIMIRLGYKGLCHSVTECRVEAATSSSPRVLNDDERKDGADVSRVSYLQSVGVCWCWLDPTS